MTATTQHALHHINSVRTRNNADVQMRCDQVPTVKTIVVELGFVSALVVAVVVAVADAVKVVLIASTAAVAVGRCVCGSCRGGLIGSSFSQRFACGSNCRPISPHKHCKAVSSLAVVAALVIQHISARHQTNRPSVWVHVRHAVSAHASVTARATSQRPVLEVAGCHRSGHTASPPHLTTHVTLEEDQCKISRPRILRLANRRA